MAIETIAVPEECVPRVISVIMQGLGVLGRPRGVAFGAEADEILRYWCDTMAAKRLQLGKSEGQK